LLLEGDYQSRREDGLVHVAVVSESIPT